MLLKQFSYPFNDISPLNGTIIHIGIECPYLIPFDFEKTIVITIGNKNEKYFIGSINNILEADQLNFNSNESFSINIGNIPKDIQKFLLIDLFYE